MDFGKRLEQVILDKYKNIRQFAEAHGLNYSGVRGYIIGTYEPRLSKVEELAECLGVSATWLAYGSNDDINSEEIKQIVQISERLEVFLKEKNKAPDLDTKSEIIKILYKQAKKMKKDRLSEDYMNEQISLIMNVGNID